MRLIMYPTPLYIGSKIGRRKIVRSKEGLVKLRIDMEEKIEHKLKISNGLDRQNTIEMEYNYSPAISDSGLAWDGYSNSSSSYVSQTSESSMTESSDVGHARRPTISELPAVTNEKLIPKPTIKSDLSQLYQRLENAYPLLHGGQKENAEACINIVHQVISETWASNSEMVTFVCEHLQKCGLLDVIFQMFINDQFQLRLETGKVLEAYLSSGNVNYLIQRGFLKEFVATIIRECDKKDEANIRLALSLFETLFRHGTEVGKEIVELGGLDYVIDVCKCHMMNVESLQHAAVAFSNLAVFGNTEIYDLMIKKQVHVWLFVLASHDDEKVKYYAFLTVCMLATNKCNERAVSDTGILPLVMNFIKNRKPEEIAKLDVKHGAGRSKLWLNAFAKLLSSSLPEVVSLALFQLVMEASLRKGTDKIEIFEKLGLVANLQDIASCPPLPIAGEYAARLLAFIGEPIPYKLTQSVPLWNIKDVHYWVRKVGFPFYADTFMKHRVDGDLLLRTSDDHLRSEIKITSAYERMRFLRELNILKRSADYSCVDPTRLDMWLTRLDPELSIYTYQMLLKGMERNSLLNIDTEILQDLCEVDNPVYCMKILHALKEVKHVSEADLAVLRKQVDIFISYRRSNGSQLASLLKVHLQLKGFKVFLDVDRLFAGQFDKSLLDNIRAARHFLLVLTPHALDPCVGDVDCKDWVHIEVKTALESGANIVPVQEKNFDWPQVRALPSDMQAVCSFNAIQWVHEYQEACVDKLYRFLHELDTQRSINTRTTTTSTF